MPSATPQNNLVKRNLVISGICTVEVGLTNDDREESREFTEAEENVMRPINMQQEKTTTINSVLDQ